MLKAQARSIISTIEDSPWPEGITIVVGDKCHQALLLTFGRPEVWLDNGHVFYVKSSSVYLKRQKDATKIQLKLAKLNNWYIL